MYDACSNSRAAARPSFIAQTQHVDLAPWREPTATRTLLYYGIIVGSAAAAHTHRLQSSQTWVMSQLQFKLISLR